MPRTKQPNNKVTQRRPSRKINIRGSVLIYLIIADFYWLTSGAATGILDREDGRKSLPLRSVQLRSYPPQTSSPAQFFRFGRSPLVSRRKPIVQIGALHRQ